MAEVTIAIPVYNRETQLRTAVESALAQTFDDVEILVVDNASTDATAAVGEEYARGDSRVRVVRNERNLGPAGNWRKCVETAGGRYVKLLFSDDWLAPDAVGRMLTVLEGRPHVGFVYSSMRWYLGADLEGYVFYRGPGDGAVESVDFLARSATIQDAVPVTPSSALFRTRDAVELLPPAVPTRLDHDFNRYGLGNDATLLWRCCERYRYVYRLQEPLVSSSDLDAGEPNTRMTLGSDSEVIWWAYRNAFARFVATSSLPAPVRRKLQTTLLLSTLALSPSSRRRALRTYPLLFPEGYRWWGVGFPGRLALRDLVRPPTPEPAA